MKKYKLSNENIDLASERVITFLSDAGVEQEDIIRIRLALEEVLLKYQQDMGLEHVFSLKCIKKLKSLKIELFVPGSAMNPFEQEEELSSEVLQGILSGMGIAPCWKYKNGTNLILFTPRKREKSQMVSLGMSIGAALLCGAVCSFFPDTVKTFLAGSLIGPVFSTFMGLLTAISGPMIFLSVAWGIYSIGDTVTLGKIGKKMIGRIIIMSFLLTVLGGIIVLPFFPLSLNGESAFDFASLFQIVLDIVPDNLFTPFVEGNPLQIIFVAILIGASLLILESKTTMVANGMEQFNFIVQLLMDGVSAFVPFFVFGSILKMILENNVKAFLKCVKLFSLLILSYIVITIFYLFLVAIQKKVKPTILIKKVLPTFLIGLGTASSAAAFATNIECCKKKLGINEKIVNFGIPLGQVIFMPAAALLYFVSGLCMAEIYGVLISPSWLFIALLITVILSIATPPIPGGGLTCFTMLFIQLQIPKEAIAIMITLNLVLEFMATPVDLFCLQAEMVELAGSLDMLDVDCLRRE